MEEKFDERLFRTYIDGDSLYPLKNGKIISYYFRSNYEISVFNGKTFQKIFFFDLYEIIKKYEKEEDEEDYFYKNNNCLKEIENDIILIGRDRCLIELNFKENNYDYKLVQLFDDIGVNINELEDKNIIILTKNKIYLYIKKKKKIILLKKNIL